MLNFWMKLVPDLKKFMNWQHPLVISTLSYYIYTINNALLVEHDQYIQILFEGLKKVCLILILNCSTLSRSDKKIRR